MENWKDVLGYEGRYQTSDLGKVKSVVRTVGLSAGWKGDKWRQIDERILKPAESGGVSGRRYLMVGLSKGNRVRLFYIHRLVWESFHGPISRGLEINHKDGNKKNNHLANLELVTRKENTAHAIQAGLSRIHFKGSKNPRAVLDDKAVRQIKMRLDKGDVQRRIAEDFGVCPQTITNIKKGVTWQHLE